MVPETLLRTPAESARFWAKIDRRGPDDCWPWIAGKGSHGYGVHYLPGRVQVLAHRTALLLESGRPEHSSAHALHSCDHKWCANPAHLHWGDHAENMRESAERGRAKPGLTLGSACPKGHEYTPENTLTSTRMGPHNKRYTVHACRECNRIYLARRRAERREKEVQKHGK